MEKLPLILTPSVVWLALLIFAKADVPSGPVESAAWKKRIIASIDQVAQKPPEKAIPLLAERIFGLSRPWNISPHSEEVTKYLKQRLIEIPGHAKYYQDKIEAMKLEVIANSTKTDDELNDMRSGEREVANEFSYSDYCELSKHGVIAEGEVDAWQDWWNEVKAGQRTYRFAGSPVEYGPDGPVSKEKLAEIQRGEKRNEDRLAGKKKSGDAAAGSGKSGDKPFPFAMVFGGVVEAVAAGWFLFRERLGA